MIISCSLFFVTTSIFLIAKGDFKYNTFCHNSISVKSALATFCPGTDATPHESKTEEVEDIHDTRRPRSCSMEKDHTTCGPCGTTRGQRSCEYIQRIRNLLHLSTLSSIVFACLQKTENAVKQYTKDAIFQTRTNTEGAQREAERKRRKGQTELNEERNA